MPNKPTPNPFERILKAAVKGNPKPKKKPGKKKPVSPKK